MSDLRYRVLLYQLRTVKIRSQNVAGFALPTAIFLGMLAILMALTTIVRSQSSQATAKGLQKKIQAGFVADAGVSQILASLKDSRYQTLLARNHDPVDASGSTYLGSDGIPQSGDETTTPANQWANGPIKQPNPCKTANASTLKSFFPIDATNPDFGGFQLLAYRANGNTGYALIQGSRPNVGIARRWVSLPLDQVRNNGKYPFPGVFASNTVNMDRLDVYKVPGEIGKNANVVCANCGFNPIGVTAGNPNCQNEDPTAAAIDASLQRAGAGASVIDGQATIIPTAKLEPVPAYSLTDCSLASGFNCSFNLGSTLDGTTITSVFPSSPYELPRPSDIAIINTWPVDQPVVYRVGQITLNGINIQIDPSKISGRAVHVYVTGSSLNLTGGAQLLQATYYGKKVENLRFFGVPDDPTNTVPDQTFVLSGMNSAIRDGIIHAPDATLRLVDHGSVTGAVWMKDIDSSATDFTSIFVPDSIPDSINPLSGSLAAWQIRPVTLWNQQPVD
jgi:hypothetical protein